MSVALSVREQHFSWTLSQMEFDWWHCLVLPAAVEKRSRWVLSQVVEIEISTLLEKNLHWPCVVSMQQSSRQYYQYWSYFLGRQTVDEVPMMMRLRLA